MCELDAGRWEGTQAKINQINLLNGSFAFRHTALKDLLPPEEEQDMLEPKGPECVASGQTDLLTLYRSNTFTMGIERVD